MRRFDAKNNNNRQCSYWWFWAKNRKEKKYEKEQPYESLTMTFCELWRKKSQQTHLFNIETNDSRMSVIHCFCWIESFVWNRSAQFIRSMWHYLTANRELKIHMYFSTYNSFSFRFYITKHSLLELIYQNLKENKNTHTHILLVKST